MWGVAWSRNETLDQDLIVSGSVDNTVRVWAWSAPPTFTHSHYNHCHAILRDDASSLLEPKWTFEGHQLGVVSVATNSSGTGNNVYSLVDFILTHITLTHTHTHTHHPPTVCASSGLDGLLKVWDLSAGEEMRSIDGGPVDIWTLAFSPDSQVSQDTLFRTHSHLVLTPAHSDGEPQWKDQPLLSLRGQEGQCPGHSRQIHHECHLRQSHDPHVTSHH